MWARSRDCKEPLYLMHMQGGSKLPCCEARIWCNNLKQHCPTKATLLANILQEDMELFIFASLCHSTAVKISGNEKNLLVQTCPFHNHEYHCVKSPCEVGFIDHSLFQSIELQVSEGSKHKHEERKWKRRRTM